MKWSRTCQDCGHTAFYEPPPKDKEPSWAWLEKACKKCKSPSLDRGTWAPENEVERKQKAREAELWFAETDEERQEILARHKKEDEGK